jgi:RNA polymerase sigma-70 factor (ECF subfamily)
MQKRDPSTGDPPQSASPEVAATGEPVRDHAAEISRLFREHNRALVLFLAARLKDENAAKEVAQEAYVKVLQLERPGAVSFLRSYLFRVAANLAIDRLRQQKTRARIDERVGFEDFVEDSMAERAAAATAELESLKRFIRELPPRYGQAFDLYSLLEKPLEEVAQEMKVSQRMARHYVTLSLVYLRLRREGSSAAAAWSEIQS